MVIDIGRIPEEGASFEGEEPASILELRDEAVEAVGPIAYSIRAELRSGTLIVRGALRTEVRLRCGRCAAVFPATVSDEQFACVKEPGCEGEAPEGARTPGVRHASAAQAAAAEAIPLDQLVDLTAEIRESILLAFPSYPLCSADCKGLCFRCGRNLNRGGCTCTEAQADNRWSALEKLSL